MMQLTKTSWDFELVLIGAGAAYLALAWGAERYFFPWLAKIVGKAKQAVMREPKRRKKYKTVQEAMRI